MTIYVKKPKYSGFVKSFQRSAYFGFQDLGYDVETFEFIKEVPKIRDNLLVSGLEETVKWLNDFGINPPLIDYPDELRQFLGRDIIKTKIEDLELILDGKRYFLKPVQEKQFETSIVEYCEDLQKFNHIPQNTEIWLSEFKQFDAEYRCYISDKKILGCFKYKGHSKYKPNLEYIQKMVDKYNSSPIGYTLDVGVTDKNEVLLIEINDGFSVENYGLEDSKYALFLLNRWDELFV